MFWVDEITDNILKTYPDKKDFILRDEKTPSGRVHIGSMRGVVIHGIIAQALQERGINAKFYYEINDADPMDGLPIYLDQEKFRPYMGKPLKDVPSPDSKAKNYGAYFGEEFIEVINQIGFHPEIVWASDLYKAGKYDKWIEIVLNHKEEIRQIYKEVSGSEKPADWYPLQIICEKCGKVGTTKVINWDGKEVEYVCKPDLVTWAEGCGHQGKVSPFLGRGKLPWKVEWGVKWQIMPVDIEGSGKDHGTAGGSHDISEQICQKVFKGPVPFNIPYEFLLYGGAKMSSSKGMGAAVKEVARIIPPTLMRFLMVRSWPNHTIEFDPVGDTLLRLYDKYDEAARSYFEPTPESQDLKQMFHYSELDPSKITQKYLPRFSRVVFMIQIPRLDILQECEKLKGSALTAEDKQEIEERVAYGKIWLDGYAPEAYKFQIQKDLPEQASSLSADQKKFLGDIAVILEQNKTIKGEDLHGKTHELRKASPLEPKAAFEAIYIALLGRPSGPQAGWFLESLDRDFVINRFREIK